MKILLLGQFLPPILGGEETHVSALAARAHDVTLLGFATSREEPGESNAEGVRIVRVRTAASYLPILYSDPARPHALPLPRSFRISYPMTVSAIVPRVERNVRPRHHRDQGEVTDVG
jgi:hypothetical protein